MKKLITALIGTLVFAAHFLATGNPDSFCITVILMVLDLALFLDYEMYLADKEIDRRIEEWNLRQQEESRILMTKTALRRELMKVWEEIA